MQMISFVLMGFVTVIFCLLLICNTLIKDMEKRISISNWILLVASYLFVVYADYRFAIILGVVTLSTYYFAKHSKYSNVGIIIALLSLGYFKYMNFFSETLMNLLGKEYERLSIFLPIGISFYVFSAIGYIVDVKRNKIKVRALKDVALYLAFFPKLTSGPIQSSNSFFEQMDSDRQVNLNSFLTGIQIFMFGMGKKTVLADRLAVFVDQVYETPMCFGSLTVFLAAAAYPLQIYFDFSGYSDMAIGVGKILGFDLPNNFNLPYVAHNVTELWKRWHITLSTWLQEYVYISLGGNRKGKLRAYVNLILTMLIGGLWHGANWTYIAWGFLSGITLVAHKVWMNISNSHKRSPSLFGSGISIICTYLFAIFSEIFFRASSISHAISIISRIFSFSAGVEHIYFWLIVAIFVFVIACVAASLKSEHNLENAKIKNVSMINGYYPVMDLSKLHCLIIFFVFCGLVLCLAYTGGSPFIYGRF